jgi:hypothetical protein
MGRMLKGPISTHSFSFISTVLPLLNLLAFRHASPTYENEILRGSLSARILFEPFIAR